MNDEQYENQKRRLDALAEKWISPLGLGWWKVDFHYARDNYGAPDGTKSQGSQRTLAHCSCDWRYGEAGITFNMQVVEDQDDDELENAFVHELMHIFLNEMRWARDDDHDGIDHEERVASTLTKAFLWLRDSLMKTKEAVVPPGSFDVPISAAHTDKRCP